MTPSSLTHLTSGVVLLSIACLEAAQSHPMFWFPLMVCSIMSLACYISDYFLPQWDEPIALLLSIILAGMSIFLLLMLLLLWTYLSQLFLLF